MRRLSLHSTTGCCLTWFLVGIMSVGVGAQQCHPNINAMPAGQRGYLGGDNLIHFRLRPASNLPSSASNALAAAVNMWNNAGGVNVKIDLVSSSYSGEVDFFFALSTDSNNTGGCASVQNGETLWLDINGVLSWANSYPDLAAYLVGHEVGHLLGLKDEGVGNWSIMNNPFQTSSCLEGAQNQQNNGAPMTPSANDIFTDGYCVTNARSSTQIRREPPAEEFQNYQSPCWERWIIWTWYNCNSSDGCWQVDQSSEFGGYWCGLDLNCYN
jgi:hypothetical protein